MKLGNVLRLLLTLFVVAALIPAAASGAGKIRGWVTDAETGEPLMGANVVVQGSSMGAATDMNGEYVILNVPVGKYVLVSSYMGFQRLEISNIIVNDGTTTFRDMKLAKTVLQGQQVSIIAEKPLIDKAQTNEVHVLRGEDIAQMPVRGVNAVISTMAGVISDNGVLHVRGGRADETGYYMDGVNVTKMTDGNNGEQFLGVSIINNAIEEVQMQTGNFGAEYGGKLGGLTAVTTKSGGSKYSLSGEVISDDFWALQKDANSSYQILGIDKLYSFGYNDYVLTAGGPIPFAKNVKFFAAGQAYNRLSQATWFEGFQQDPTQVISKATTSEGTKVNLTDTIAIDYPAGRMPGGGTYGYMGNGNLTFDFRPVRVKIGGSYQKERQTGETANPLALLTTPVRSNVTYISNYTGYLNVTHTIDPTAFYTLNLSLFNEVNESKDPVFGTDWAKYGDPAFNTALVDTSLERQWYLPFDDSMNWDFPGTPNTGNAGYSKRDQTRMTGKLDFTKQFGKAHEVKLGGELQLQKIRWFSFQAFNLAARLAQVAKDPNSYTEYDVYKALFPRMIGYDWKGNEVDADQVVATKLGLPGETTINLHNAPMEPKVGAFYLQDKIELRDLIISAGLRYDYFDNGAASLANLDSLVKGSNGGIDESLFGEKKTYHFVSPRLGFSFPVTDKATFHATFGKYYQAPDPFEVWGARGYTNLLYFLYGGYFAPLPNPNLKPEKQTSYEFGFQMGFGSNAALDVTAFYKDTRDLLQRYLVVPRVLDYRPATWTSNTDFGTIKGLSATFNLRRTARVQSTVNYTYSVAQGTGSTVSSHNDIAWQENETPSFPKVIASLDYDIRHKGTILLDFRTLDEDGPALLGMRPLGNVGLNMAFNFHSGSPYTPIAVTDAISEFYGYNAPAPLTSMNEATLPWFYQLDAKLDKSFSVGPVKLNAYLWAVNLLGSKSIVSGYRGTGRPDTDGWLQTDAGKTAVASRGADYVKWYKAWVTSCGSFGFQEPRQVRFGLRFEL
jgi:outer membrane receptor protein involved in Fe transport